ncbi:TrkH family potassium uptake protein [Lacrimispora sp. 210928-DFI.3.58]|uniref:TrkH family potassium uptake protein n=1 Tax=Lacrimispora sp. 210928-DFI.3.58 TaxID=2883214 RepID=UPI001D06CB7F|nr:TrkH family potassium uptake protein [Lacrimispora sp. 210928-DFI.3.58]MCB7320136.1 TrkH family potassium uptake protein [Lacrimispora sp. 210928-DFI.3.58]
MNNVLSEQKKRYARLRKTISQTQFIAYGFFLIIITGSLLLMLPASSRDGASEPFLNCLFTATSATCVTGLVVADTWTQWSLLGQVFLLVMIQLGGLGFISIGIFLAIVLRRKIGLKERGLMQESVNTLQIGGMVKLAKRMILGTALFEGAGAVLLAFRFIPQYGFVKGLWYSIFHSVSAFCNAGFDLMGHREPYNSLCAYTGDWLVIGTISFLIITGGIGFIVWDDLYKKRFHVRHYLLHTKIVLVTTAVMLSVGTLLFYLLEHDNLLVGMSGPEQFLACLFCSVTPRTAGFNSVDTAALTDGSKFLTAVLMFIGGSPGSTAGGIKTTTLAVLLLCVWSSIRQTHGVEIFGRRLEEESIRQSAGILTINLSLMIGATILIMVFQNLPMSDIFFETCSAMGTSGMSTGITRALGTGSRLVLILLMYCGRIGSLSFALAFTRSSRKPQVQLPAERITIG